MVNDALAEIVVDNTVHLIIVAIVIISIFDVYISRQNEDSIHNEFGVIVETLTQPIISRLDDMKDKDKCVLRQMIGLTLDFQNKQTDTKLRKQYTKNASTFLLTYVGFIGVLVLSLVQIKRHEISWHCILESNLSITAYLFLFELYFIRAFAVRNAQEHSLDRKLIKQRVLDHTNALERNTKLPPLTNGTEPRQQLYTRVGICVLLVILLLLLLVVLPRSCDFQRFTRPLFVSMGAAITVTAYYVTLRKQTEKRLHDVKTQRVVDYCMSFAKSVEDKLHLANLLVSYEDLKLPEVTEYDKRVESNDAHIRMKAQYDMKCIGIVSIIVLAIGLLFVKNRFAFGSTSLISMAIGGCLAFLCEYSFFSTLSNYDGIDPVEVTNAALTKMHNQLPDACPTSTVQ